MAASINLVTEMSLAADGASKNFVTEISLSGEGASRNLVMLMSLSSARNLVTLISFSSRSFDTAESSKRKLARAVSMNFVTETSLASKNLAVAVPKNSITVNSRYLVTAISSA